MNREDIKIVVTDLDGTLLKNDKSISDYTLGIINEFRRQGNLFVIATARPVRAVKKYMSQMEFDAGIYHNGAVIYDKNIRIGGYGIDKPHIVAKNILGIYPNTCMAIEADNVLYANFDCKRLWPDSDFVYSDNFQELNDKIADKIIVEVSSIDDLEKYKSILPDQLYIQLSENKIGMIMNREATKMNGIKKLSMIYQVDMKNIISFGDDYNDMDMILGCGKGIVVENAPKAIKDIATEICKSNENDGVANWIKENL